MKKRILAIFTCLTILTNFTINLAFATSTPGAPINSGEVVTPTVSGDVTPAPTPTISGDITPTISGDITPPTTSGDISGEIITVSASDIEIEIEKNTILTANFNATSTVADSTLTYIIVEQPSHGTLVHSEATNKAFTYTPDLDYVGNDYFTYQVSDGISISNIAKVSIIISLPDEEIIPFYYVDMQEHWANYSASHLAARGLIIGEEIGSRFYFYPNREMTRADFILFLLAITESNEDANIEMPNVKFADEETTPSWLIEAAKLAYAKGIIKGSADGNQIYLNAYNLLTRKEATVMIDNTLNLTDSTDSLTYADTTSIPDWATQAVKNLTAYKIIQGDSENNFNPNKVLTRAEAAEMSYKLVKQLESEEMPGVSGDSSGDIK